MKQNCLFRQILTKDKVTAFFVTSNTSKQKIPQQPFHLQHIINKRAPLRKIGPPKRTPFGPVPHNAYATAADLPLMTRVVRHTTVTRTFTPFTQVDFTPRTFSLFAAYLCRGTLQTELFHIAVAAHIRFDGVTFTDDGYRQPQHKKGKGGNGNQKNQQCCIHCSNRVNPLRRASKAKLVQIFAKFVICYREPARQPLPRGGYPACQERFIA